jgi:hypothetical protein
VIIYKKFFIKSKHYINVRDYYTVEGKFQLEALMDLDMCDFKSGNECEKTCMSKLK